MSKTPVVSLLLCYLVGLPGAQRLLAQQAAPTPQPPQPPATAPTAKEEPSPYPKFEEVTKGMESKAGLFTLWYYPASAKDKDTEKLLCQIPASFLGQNFMLSTSQAGGGCFPVDEKVVKWEVLDRQLLLIEPETRYVADEKGTISDIVKRTYSDRIRAAVPIVTRSPAGDPVIDLGPLLKGGLANIGYVFSSFGSRMGGGVNASLSKWTKKKAFELNVEIGVELAVSAGYPPGSYNKQLLHYSFWKLPASDYKPRVADDRVGYFLTAHQDWAKPTESRDLFNRYIDRWHLVKRDASLPRCEPREPIIFYVEKTVPIRFRKAVRDGILEWNKAFDRLGFVDAIQVRQQTEDNEWKDIDPEDMRYSFFRWIVTGGAFAMGPHRSNPFTGQIYDADIVFDDSMVRFQEMEARHMIPTGLVELKMSDPTLRRFVELCPEWMRTGKEGKEWHSFAVGEPRPNVSRALHEHLSHKHMHHCDYARGMMHQLIVAQAVLADQPKEVIDRLLYDVIKQIVAHEVGHTLGLRHNFKASSIYSLEEICRRRMTGEPTSGSVMDYNPVLYTAENPTEGFFITPTLGPWDYWVIEYGYRPADGSYQPLAKAAKDEPKAKPETAPAQADKNGDIPPELLAKLPAHVRKMIEAAEATEGKDAKSEKNEKGKPDEKAKKEAPRPALAGEEAMLQAIAARAAEPELAYATDEDTTFLSPDPRTNRYDAGADPVDWAKDRIAVINKRMANLLDWAAKEGESWYHARRAFEHLMMEKAFVLDYVGRYIGGQYISRSHRGDPDGQPPFVLVDAATQRRAMNFIQETLFNDQFFEVPAHVLNHLSVPRWYHDGAYVTARLDFPIHDMISILQWWNLYDRLFPDTLRRIQDAEMKVEKGEKFTVAEYIQTIQKACWGDSVNVGRRAGGKWSNTSPFVSDVRRSLQREYLGIVEPMVRMQPGMMLSPDLHAMLQHSLSELSRQIGEVLRQPGEPLDFASAAHLSTCKTRIDRMLSAPLEEYSGRSYSMMILGQQAAPADEK